MNGKFMKELQTLINQNSLENDSNTPDFILAEFLCDVLEAFSRAVKKRDAWYGRENRLTETEIKEALAKGAEDVRRHREATPPPMMKRQRYRGGR